MKISNNTIGNRTSVLPACSAVPQLRHRVPLLNMVKYYKYIFFIVYYILYIHILGYAVAQLVEALRYMPEGRGFDSR